MVRLEQFNLHLLNEHFNEEGLDIHTPQLHLVLGLEGPESLIPHRLCQVSCVLHRCGVEELVQVSILLNDSGEN